MGTRLRIYEGSHPASLTGGRAFLYGLAIQAALDVGAVALDKRWELWAAELASISAEVVYEDGMLKECPLDERLISLPITDAVMVFDESSVELFAMAEARMEALGVPMFEEMSGAVSGLPESSLDNPILATDRIEGALFRHFGKTYIHGSGISGEMRKTISRAPLRSTASRSEGSGAKVREVDAKGNARVIGGVPESVVPALPRDEKGSLFPDTKP